MSLYRECSQAVERLMEHPPAKHGGVFTEIDVTAKAATREWSNDNLEEAMRHANQVCGTKYRERKLCRYGPVVLPDGTEDYARIASKIVYADADTGPDEWETPNGVFPKMMIEEDPLTAQGRRRGTVRNDLVAWDDQTHTARPLSREARLKQELEAAKRQVARSQAELDRLREIHANGDLLETVENLTQRVRILEERDRKRLEVYG